MLVRLLGFLRGHPGAALLGTTLALLTVIANVGLLALSGWFIAMMAIAGTTGALVNYFLPGVLVRVLALTRTGGRYLERLVNHNVTLRILATMRVRVYRAIEPLAPAKLVRSRGGDLLSRIRADVDTLDDFYVRGLVPAVVAVAGSTITVVFVASFSAAHASALAFFLSLAGIGVPLAAARAGSTHGPLVVDAASDLRSAVIAHASGVPELTVFGTERIARAEVEELAERYDANVRGTSWITGGTDAAMTLVTQGAAFVALVLLAGTRNGLPVTGPVAALLVSLFYGAFEAVMPMQQAAGRLGEMARAAQRMFELDASEPAVVDPPEPARRPVSTDLRLHGLSLTYETALEPALAGVDLQIPEGEHLALIGPTGSGKSSLVNVLLRFYEYHGSATIGGVELNALRADDVRSFFALSPQQPDLFHASIRENLLLGRRDASDAEIARAIDLASAEFIHEIGLDTPVGESGARLSAGQARRIAVARAVLKDAPVLLLDEPTEGLDPITARAMLERLFAAYRERTVLLITHRHHEIRHVDRVVRIDRGRLMP